MEEHRSLRAIGYFALLITERVSSPKEHVKRKANAASTAGQKIPCVDLIWETIGVRPQRPKT